MVAAPSGRGIAGSLGRQALSLLGKRAVCCWAAELASLTSFGFTGSLSLRRLWMYSALNSAGGKALSAFCKFTKCIPFLPPLNTFYCISEVRLQTGS